jgi:hypothetical protein
MECGRGIGWGDLGIMMGGYFDIWRSLRVEDQFQLRILTATLLVNDSLSACHDAKRDPLRSSNLLPYQF